MSRQQRLDAAYGRRGGSLVPAGRRHEDPGWKPGDMGALKHDGRSIAVMVEEVIGPNRYRVTLLASTTVPKATLIAPGHMIEDHPAAGRVVVPGRLLP